MVLNIRVLFRPSNPGSNTSDEDCHGCIGGYAPSEAGITAVAVEESIMAIGQREAGDDLSVNSVGVWRPIHFCVVLGLSKPIEFHRSRHVSHHEPSSPEHAYSGEEKGNAEEIILNVVQTISILFALKFNQTNGNRKRGQSAYEKHEEVLIGGIFVKGNAEHTAPYGDKTNPHHDDLREFHQE